MRSLAFLLFVLSFSLSVFARPPAWQTAPPGAASQDAAPAPAKPQTSKDAKDKSPAPCAACTVMPGKDEPPKPAPAASIQENTQCDRDKNGMVIPCSAPKPVCKDAQGNTIPCKPEPPPKNQCGQAPRVDGAVIPCSDQGAGTEKKAAPANSKKQTGMPGKVD